MFLDYAKLDEYSRRHFQRFERFVQIRKLTCMECKGAGGWTEPVLDDGTGPHESCGWCEGTGYMTPHARGQWLRFKREAKRVA